MILLIILIVLGLLTRLIYLFLVSNFDYWRKRGVHGPKPWPLVGSFPNLLIRRQHFADDINDIYKRFKDCENYVGIFLMRTPNLLILDPAMVHQVFVTAFKHFENNDIANLIDKKKDRLIANNPFLLTGLDWREQRALITPGMTSSRIKFAYQIMQDITHKMCRYIQRESDNSPKNGLNGKDIALRFTCENVCSSVLGIRTYNFTDHAIPVADNVNRFATNNPIFLLYTVMAGLFPGIVKRFKPKFFPDDVEEFFLDLMYKAFRMREENKNDQHDFLNHLLSLKENHKVSDIELASHSMTFLIDGLDTTAAAIAHGLLLLAREPDAQDKLRQEILMNLNQDSTLSFEKLNELPYLDACVHESLRIFPPGLFATKNCTIPFEFTNKNGEKIMLQVGETVMLPLHALHHDPDYWPEPEKFMPERFLPENGDMKKYRDMGIYLGFGDGPRMCLGMRFALVQTKAAISGIIKNFKIHVNPKTRKENKLEPKIFLPVQKGGIWLDFEKLSIK